MENSGDPSISVPLWQQLNQVLQTRSAVEFPHVPNPSGCEKRAAVALIIRIRPTYPDRPTSVPADSRNPENSVLQRLNTFFAQEWVQRGDPEVLFIKRAAREGDRWTSHIALPGGRRDAADVDDRATSVRETNEEVGLNLQTPHCLPVGNLPQRVITTMWGKTPLMVLCPYIYIMMSPNVPALTLQPTEIHSAHWVSLRALQCPLLSIYKPCDISDRFTKSGNRLTRAFIRAVFGQAMFPAIHLVPSESLYCSTAPHFLPSASPNDHTKPWLPLGFIADLLGTLPSYRSSELLFWPTMSPPDSRLLIWLFTYNFRRKKVEKSSEIAGRTRAIEVTTKAAGVGSMDDTTVGTSADPATTKFQESTLWDALDEYFDLSRRAVLTALAVRSGAAAVLAYWLIKRVRRRRGAKL
ncbi:MAG: hypothetical protein LQ351_006607 [Letrouitia transgressa]|nr:MAG: hypothetical protein LQ351_006607 [Letrouitia transgressa]